MFTSKNALLRTGAVVATMAALGVASAALAFHSPEHYSLFGDASYASPGNSSNRAIHLVSDASLGYGGVDYTVEASTTFATLTTLMSDYRLESDDVCIGGSPRFQINVIDPNTSLEKNIFAYFGVDSAGAPCISGSWDNTGDLLETGRLLDTSQLTGGTFYDPYASALTKYGTWTVTGIQVVTDSSWAAADSEHAVDIDNTTINSTLFTYEVPTATASNQCKQGGWRNYADTLGNSFKNQGDCVSFVATGGKNMGAGN